MSSSSTTQSSPVRGQSPAIFPRSFSLWHLVVHQEQIQNETISSLWHFKNRNNLPKESSWIRNVVKCWTACTAYCFVGSTNVSSWWVTCDDDSTIVVTFWWGFSDSSFAIGHQRWSTWVHQRWIFLFLNLSPCL